MRFARERAAQFAQQAHEPIRREPRQHPLILRCAESLRSRERGLQENDAKEQGKRGYLQKRRDAQKPSARQLRRYSLHAENRAVEKRARRRQDDPEGRHKTKGPQDTGTGGGPRPRPRKGGKTV